MQPNVFDLRAFNLPSYLVSLVTISLLAAAALYAAASGQVSEGSRTTMWVLGGVFAVFAVVGIMQLPRMRRPRRLVIDHDGIRLEGGGRAFDFRVAWTELTGVGLLVDDRHRFRPHRHLIPRSLISISVMLEMVPADEAAQQRHPELSRAWLLGGRRTWRVWLTTGPGDPLSVGHALQRHRPDLWRGQRSGSIVFG